MSRGGYYVMRPSIILHGPGWAGRSFAARGVWEVIRALNELTEQPVSIEEAERLGMSPDDLAELDNNGLLDTEGGYTAMGMPQPGKNPSDEPAAVNARKAKSRANRKAAKEAAEKLAAERDAPAPQRETPVQSIPFQVTSSHAVTGRDIAPPDGEEPSAGDVPKTEGSKSEGRAVAVPRVGSEGVSLPPTEALSRALSAPMSWEEAEARRQAGGMTSTSHQLSRARGSLS